MLQCMIDNVIVYMFCWHAFTFVLKMLHHHYMNLFGLIKELKLKLKLKALPFPYL